LRCALDLEEHLVVVVCHLNVEVLGLRLFRLVRVGRSFGRHVCGAGAISEGDTVGRGCEWRGLCLRGDAHLRTDVVLKV